MKFLFLTHCSAISHRSYSLCSDLSLEFFIFCVVKRVRALTGLVLDADDVFL